ncbi:uncharacterized protein LOC143586820 [Bidens hawaiensis]|uniref:uncharacterized protein LOC143586820 n=1 Tax=Bidens hawaiensis TaxID=980011 RepID=UPI00404AFA98
MMPIKEDEEKQNYYAYAKTFSLNSDSYRRTTGLLLLIWKTHIMLKDFNNDDHDDDGEGKERDLRQQELKSYHVISSYGPMQIVISLSFRNFQATVQTMLKL